MKSRTQAVTRPRRSMHFPLPGISMVFVAAGCATNSDWQTETTSADFAAGTHILGELILIMSRDQALSGDGMLKHWREKLHDLGYTDADIVDGSGATVWTYCYGHNSGVPLCAHHGHYVVHVPQEFRSVLNFGEDGNAETTGDPVEIELVKTARGQIVGRLVSVYRAATDWGDCRVCSLERSSLSNSILVLSSVGSPRAIWLECDSAEADGWTRRPVRVAPPAEQVPVSEWIK